MANTYTLIASSTVGSGGAASIDFSSIPATYSDLCLKYSLRSNLAQVYGDTFIYINGSQTSYSSKLLEGSGAGSGSSNSGASTYVYGEDGVGNSATANTFSNAETYFPNYAGSNNKSFSVDSVGENNATTAYIMLVAGLWSNTSAINRITLSTSATSITGGTQLFLQYSTAYLYGVNNA
jgi:hypothetical protein